MGMGVLLAESRNENEMKWCRGRVVGSPTCQD